MITLEGIVLKERSVGEQDKFIDILTKESGVVEVSVKGARKISGKSGSSTQLFAYSRFCLRQQKERFYLNSAEPIHIFYGLRDSLSSIALASYFAEVLRFCIASETPCGEALRLFLNTLHYLEKKLRDEKLLKCIFELRLMAETGFAPDILACSICGEFEPAQLHFCIDEGFFCCSDCFEPQLSQNNLPVRLPVLNAVRHIILADFDRLFNFRVSENVLGQLSQITETYMLTHLEKSFSTLDFYKLLS